MNSYATVGLPNNKTSREIEEEMTPRCPKPGEIERLYEARSHQLVQLTASGTIQRSDLDTLDRLGRFKVATEHFSRC